MSAAEIEVEAELLYTQRVAERGPRWEQLGDTTKSVWREYVVQGQRADLW
jgi:hypothetical protein